MAMTASALRRDIYRILDRVLETGELVIIERNGRQVRRPDVVVGDSARPANLPLVRVGPVAGTRRATARPCLVISMSSPSATSSSSDLRLHLGCGHLPGHAITGLVITTRSPVFSGRVRKDG
jgi:hypothetical protein